MTVFLNGVARPVPRELLGIRGGAESLETIDDELDAMPDMAEVRSLASPVTLTAAFQYVYTDAPGRPFYFAGGFISRASGAWATGETVVVNVEVNDGTGWVEIWTASFAAEPTPAQIAIPSHDPDNVLLNIPLGFWNNGDGVRVGIKQTTEGAAYHTWKHSFLDAVAGT